MLRTVSRLAVAVVAAFSVLWLAVAAWAAVAGTATPNANLHSGDTTHVHADGLPALTTIAVTMCSAGASSSADCEGQSADVSGQTNNQGVFDLDYTVFEWPNGVFPSASITCNHDNPCVLYVGTDFNDFSQPKTLVPISFAGPDPVVPEVSKTILLPLSAVAFVGLGMTISQRRRRLAGSDK